MTNATPTLAIADDETCLALYLPIGTLALDNYDVASTDRVAAVGAVAPSAERAHVERRWTLPVIKLYLPETAFSAWLFFDDGWSFTAWYGNLEAPYQRTPIGLDTQDHVLDVLADPQLRWRLKDEAEFERRLALGIDTAEHQAGVRAAASAFIDRLKGGAPPFDRDWTSWRPPQGWAVPVLPSNWRDDFGTRFRRR